MRTSPRSHQQWLSFILLLPAATAARADTSLWQGADGLLPDQISPPYTLFDSALGADPVLSGGVLTLSTAADPEGMGYAMTGGLISIPPLLVMEAQVRRVSGGSSHVARAPIDIRFSTGPNVGNSLYIGNDEIFLLSDDLVRGQTAAVDTDGAFHTYRIEVSGAAAGSAIAVFYDGSPILSGQSFFDVAANDPMPRIVFGQNSGLAFGASQWTMFSHNALVPEPATATLACLLLAGLAARRRRVACTVGCSTPA